MDNTQNPVIPELTKEDFRLFVQDVVQDMADPEGDFQVMARERENIKRELNKFDPVMATKFDSILGAIEDFGTYAASKGEFLGEEARNLRGE